MFSGNDGFAVVHTFSENDMFVALLLAAALAKPADLVVIPDSSG